MTKEINLKNGRKALVDDDDFEYLSRFKWYWVHGYAYRNIGKGNERTTILMHDEIMRPPKGLVIDHINGIKTDNRICNLREATDQENKQNISKPRKDNTSGFLGVSFRADRQKWRALISHNGRYIHLGHFHTPEEACMAYKKAKCFYHPFYNKENTQ